MTALSCIFIRMYANKQKRIKTYLQSISNINSYPDVKYLATRGGVVRRDIVLEHSMLNIVRSHKPVTF